MSSKLTDDVGESLRAAARKLSGFRRRQFQAEMALKYCDGSSRKAETVFGWRRNAVNTGLNELRTGIRCVDNTGARERKKTEEAYPQLEQRIRQIVEPHLQADPKFQTTLVDSRITAARVREELRKDDELKPVVPSRQTVGEILNRLGDCLRRVQKTLPEKNPRNRRDLCQRPRGASAGGSGTRHVENLAGDKGQGEGGETFPAAGNRVETRR